MDNILAKIKIGERFTFFVSYLLISLMMGCIAISLVQLVNRIFPHWQGMYAVILVVLISLERIFSIVKTDSFELGKKIIYHIAEWVTIAVGLKIILYTLNGFDSFFKDIQDWQTNFILFFSGEYIPVLILLALSWWISGSFTTDMEELRVDSLDLHWEVGILENRRQDAREAIINRILWLGIIMIFAAVLTRLDIATLFGPYQAYQAPVINTLFYFLCALLLFSQTQFSLLRGRWMWHQTPPPTMLGQSWLKYGAGFLLLITLLAFLLPTHYTFGFLDILRYIIIFIIQIVIVVFTLLALPFGWLLSLLSGSKSTEEPLQAPEFTNILPQNIKAEIDPTLQLLQTILFWMF